MRYISTRGQAPVASFEDVVLTGLALPEWVAVVGGGALLGLVGAWMAASYHLRRIEPRA